MAGLSCIYFRPIWAQYFKMAGLHPCIFNISGLMSVSFGHSIFETDQLSTFFASFENNILNLSGLVSSSLWAQYVFVLFNCPVGLFILYNSVLAKREVNKSTEEV